jgi:ABC-2 type transport system permease protein
MSRRVRHPLVELTLTRIREFVREPEAVFWVIVFPIAVAFALGIAFRSGGTAPVYAGVLEGAGSAEVLASLASDPGIRARTVTAADAERALGNGDVHVIVIPGRPPAYRFDPARPESRLARLTVDAALQRAAGRTDRFAAADQPVQVVGSRYIDWLIPGLLGMNIMGTSMWSIGFAVVYARTRKLLKRLAATPMSRAQFLMAQLLARMVFLVIEVSALLVFAYVAFSVSSRGALASVGAICVLGTLAFGGISLAAASRAQTIEAVSGWMNAIMMPMWIVSGVFFSSAHFPAFAQPVIRALPLTALIDALRGVMLDGASVTGIARELLTLAAWTIASFAFALKMFRWR